MSQNGMVSMHVTPWHGTNVCHWANACHTMAWHQCMSHYSMVPTYHGINACHTIALYQCTLHYDMLHHGMVPIYNAYHTMAWYQCMLHYGMVQRMSRYTMVQIHVTLLHDIYAYHTMEWY